jgi:hypothetical protein
MYDVIMDDLKRGRQLQKNQQHLELKLYVRSGGLGRQPM